MEQFRHDKGKIEERNLLPHQSRFLSNFFKEDAPQKQVLKAKPAWGVVETLAAIIEEALQKDKHIKILAIADEFWLAQLARVLLQRQTSLEKINDQLITKSTKHDQLPPSNQDGNRVTACYGYPWSLDSAMPLLFKGHWDLIIGMEEESTMFASDWRVEKLIDYNPEARVLIHTSSVNCGLNFMKGWCVTEWKASDIKNGLGEIITTDQLLNLMFLEYTLKPVDETSKLAVQTAVGMLAQLEARKRDQATGLVVASNTSSDHLKQTASALSASISSEGNLSDEIADDFLEDLNISSEAASDDDDPNPLQKALELVIHCSDKVISESKYSALRTFLKLDSDPRPLIRPTLILTSDHESARIMNGFLAQEKLLAQIYSFDAQSNAHEEIQKFVKYSEAGGILISTFSSMNYHPSLVFVEEVIAFDLPESITGAANLYSYFESLQRSKPLNVVILHPAPPTSPF